MKDIIARDPVYGGPNHFTRSPQATGSARIIGYYGEIAGKRVNRH